jgi:YgiT-type zinc finger domain-containing protein
MNPGSRQPDTKAAIDWIRAQVTENDYFNSEHIVRCLTRRIFSMGDIRQVLLSGTILEIHSHPLRSDAFLVLGVVNGEPIHVACTRDRDDNLIILYAYRPSMPTWQDEKTRAEVKGQAMDARQNAKQRTCFFCNSEIEPVTVGNFDFRWEGDLYVIKKVPAGLCVQCGEKYISAEASEKIVAKIEKEAFIEKDEVRVFDYER